MYNNSLIAIQGKIIYGECMGCVPNSQEEKKYLQRLIQKYSQRSLNKFTWFGGH
jgi:hypothetical protein